MCAAISSTASGSPKTQARVEFVLYFLFFFPGILALIFAGWKYAGRSWQYGEVSVMSPANVPIFQFKTVIVAAGILLLLPGHRPGLPLHRLHENRRMAGSMPKTSRRWRTCS